MEYHDIYFNPSINEGILGTYKFLKRWDSNRQSGLIRAIVEEIDKHETGPMTSGAEYIRKFTGKDPRMPEYTLGMGISIKNYPE